MNILDQVPLEIASEIFLSLTSFSDVLSLASTCRTAHTLFQFNSKQLAKIWPEPFELAKVLAPGNIPLWKKKKLRRVLSRRDNESFKFDFFDHDVDLRQRRGLERLREIHRRIQQWVKMHTKFPYKATLKRHEGNSSSLFTELLGVEQIKMPPKRGNGIRKSTAEQGRMIATAYKIILLHLNIFGFAYIRRKIRRALDHIVNYAPIFKLDLRTCIEIAVLSRVLFWDSHSDRTYYDTVRLSNTLCLVINIRLEVLNRSGFITLRPDDLYTYNFDNLLDYQYPDCASQNIMPHIFWDENQAVLSDLFEMLNDPYTALVANSSQPPPQILQNDIRFLGSKLVLPIKPVSRDEHIGKFMDAFDRYCLAYQNVEEPETFLAVKTDKNGMLKLASSAHDLDSAYSEIEESGFCHDNSESARWGLFARQDLYSLSDGGKEHRQLRVNSDGEYMNDVFHYII